MDDGELCGPYCGLHSRRERGKTSLHILCHASVVRYAHILSLETRGSHQSVHGTPFSVKRGAGISLVLLCGGRQGGFSDRMLRLGTAVSAEGVSPLPFSIL